jgi:hypothetical protein
VPGPFLPFLSSSPGPRGVPAAQNGVSPMHPDLPPNFQHVHLTSTDIARHDPVPAPVAAELMP